MQKFKEIANKAKEKTSAFLKNAKVKAGEIWEDHKEIIIVATPIVYSIVVKTIKQAVKNHNYREEQYLKDYYIYDRSLGKYLELRRKPSNNEYIEIQRRREDGEPLISILNSMRLLK